MSLKYIKNKIIRPEEYQELINLAKDHQMTDFAFLGLGSNLGNREEYLQKATGHISKIIGTVDLTSSLYETEPWGFKSENNFLNMVVRVHTQLNPHDLLQQVISIEKMLGRSRKGGLYRSRIIDIDILLYGEKILDDPRLKIPHPLIQHRKFVLVPLCEIVPDMVHPVLQKTFLTLLYECNDPGNIRKVT